MQNVLSWHKKIDEIINEIKKQDKAVKILEALGDINKITENLEWTNFVLAGFDLEIRLVSGDLYDLYEGKIKGRDAFIKVNQALEGTGNEFSEEELAEYKKAHLKIIKN